jgi:hypothetical protein
MVDFQIYKELHRDSLKFKELYEDSDSDSDSDSEIEEEDDRLRRKMTTEEMESETPPSEPDIYVFPGTVPGYNLRSKKWGRTTPRIKRVQIDGVLTSHFQWISKSIA